MTTPARAPIPMVRGDRRLTLRTHGNAVEAGWEAVAEDGQLLAFGSVHGSGALKLAERRALEWATAAGWELVT